MTDEGYSWISIALAPAAVLSIVFTAHVPCIESAVSVYSVRQPGEKICSDGRQNGVCVAECRWK